MKLTRPVKDIMKPTMRLPARALKDAKHLGRDLKSGLLRMPSRLPKRALGILGRGLGDTKSKLKGATKIATSPMKLLKKIF